MRVGFLHFCNSTNCNTDFCFFACLLSDFCEFFSQFIQKHAFLKDFVVFSKITSFDGHQRVQNYWGAVSVKILILYK